MSLPNPTDARRAPGGVRRGVRGSAVVAAGTFGCLLIALILRGLADFDGGLGAVFGGLLVAAGYAFSGWFRQRGEERRYRRLRENSPDAVLVCRDAEVVLANPAAAQLFQRRAPEELAGKAIRELVAGESGALAEALAGSGDCRQSWVEGRVVAADGSLREVEAVAYSFRGSQDRAVQAILRDLTASKRAAAEVCQAREAAEAAVRAQGRQLSNLRREVRTLTNGLIGVSDLLLGSPLTAQQRQYAGILRGNAEHLLGLVHGIADFSPAGAEKPRLDRVDFDLGETLREAIEMLAVQAQEKGLEIACELAPETPLLLRGDPGRLRQILVSLVGNAIEFTPCGEVTVRVEVEADGASKVRLRCSVADTGVGIPADQAGRLISRVALGEESPARKPDGPGRGLAMAKELVTWMGGRIGVDSVVGKGSTFWFTVELEKQAAGGAARAEDRGAWSGMKVLVADGHAVNRRVAGRILKSWGCAWKEAGSGDAAIGILRKAAAGGKPFRLALLDAELPGGGGAGLAARIAADRRFSGTVLVLMTGIARPVEGDRLRSLGFAGQVCKPLWNSRLREAVGAAMGEERESPPQRPAVPAPGGKKVRRGRILVAEDNQTNQEVVLAMLEQLGHEARAVADGAQAIEALKGADYDLVLMDCWMPELDGYEATRRIRGRESGVRNPGIPILALTADAMQHVREDCLKAGMNDHLTKPVDMRELNRRLEKWLRPDGPAAEPAVASGVEAAAGLVFDREDLLDRLMGNASLAQRVIRRFLESAPEQLAALSEAVELADSDHAWKTAHTIKGAAANAGGARLSEAARRMELLGRTGNLAGARELASQLEAQFEDYRLEATKFSPE